MILITLFTLCHLFLLDFNNYKRLGEKHKKKNSNFSAYCHTKRSFKVSKMLGVAKHERKMREIKKK